MSNEEREGLAGRYAWLVRHIHGQLALLLPENASYYEVAGIAAGALLRAIDTHDWQYPRDFEAYAEGLIRAAVLGLIYPVGHVARLGAWWIRMAATVIVDLTRALGACPSDADVAGRLGVDEEALRRAYRRGLPLIVRGETLTLSDSAEVDQLDAPARNWNRLEVRRRQAEALRATAGAISLLPEREQLCLSLYYREQLTLPEIAAALKLAEEKVKQLLTRSLVYLWVHLHASRHDLEAQPLRRLEAAALPVSASQLS